MAAKVTTVKLRCEAGVRSFDIETAERILTEHLRSGWILDDEQFIIENGHISRRNKEKGSGKKGA